MSQKPLYKATPLLLELKQVFKPRTKPKLPTITNKNLVVLPWDWELPSTILMSSWAQKHEQCFLVPSVRTIENPDIYAFCAIGLLMHYFGWDGSFERKEFYLDLRVVYPHSLCAHDIDIKIVNLNDDDKLSFHDIGQKI